MEFRRFLALAAAAALLTGCAASPPSRPDSPEAVPATPATERVEAPQPVFAGECSTLLDAAAAGVVVGEPVTLTPLSNTLSITYSAIPQLGGIECVWETAEAGGPVLGVVVVPDAVLDAAAADSPCVDVGYCAITDVSSGFRLYGFVYSEGGDGSTRTAGLEVLRSAFRSAVAQQTPAAPYSPEGAWTSSIDCATLDESGAFGGALGDPSVVGEPIALNNPDPNRGVADVLSAAPEVTCSWSSPEEDTTIVVQTLGGGAWVEEALAAVPGTTRVEIAGVDAALLSEGQLSVFMGVNRLTVEVRSSAGGPAIDSLFAPVGEIARRLAAG